MRLSEKLIQVVLLSPLVACQTSATPKGRDAGPRDAASGPADAAGVDAYAVPALACARDADCDDGRSYNDVLLDVSGFAMLDRVIGAFTIHDNRDLAGITGFGKLTNVDANLELQRNASLADVAGLPSLGVLGGDLLVHDNPVLGSLGPLGSFTIDVTYNLTIKALPF